MNTNNVSYLESFLVTLDITRKLSEKEGKSFKSPITASLAQYRSAWNRLCLFIEDDMVIISPDRIESFLHDNTTVNRHFIRPILINAIKNNTEQAFENCSKEMLYWLL